MGRRLGSLALVLVSSLSLVVTPAWAGPPEPEPEPPPSVIEGPALPPSEPPPPSIEFAPLTPDPEATTNTVPRTSIPPPMSRREEIGKAPSSGASFLAGGLWLLPLAAYGTVRLVQADLVWEYPPYPAVKGIIVAGAGLGLIGAAMVGMGIHRRVALGRWATRHRVIPLAQGSGLLTSGTLAFLIGVGILVPAIMNQDPINGAVAGALLVSSPIQIGVGSQFARRYERTGGWRATAYTLGPGGFRLQF